MVPNSNAAFLYRSRCYKGQEVLIFLSLVVNTNLCLKLYGLNHTF
jgi:hypothetical protein